MTLQYPELPDAARPRWPAWYGPLALVGSLLALAFFFPALPIVLLGGFSDSLAALSLLVLIVLQDAILSGAAILFSSFKLRPRPWHFGLRPTRPWPTIGWAVVGFGLMLGLEVAYVELLDVSETNVDDLSGEAIVAATLVAIAVIVVAPIAEEFFFRAFFYRALRSRLPVWLAAPIDGVVFGALHFEGMDTAIILPMIAMFGVGQCLVYERTGSLFAVIAIHAAFNTVATLGMSPAPALVIGLSMLAGCLLMPGRLSTAPSPVRA